MRLHHEVLTLAIARLASSSPNCVCGLKLSQRFLTVNDVNGLKRIGQAGRELVGGNLHGLIVGAACRDSVASAARGRGKPLLQLVSSVF